MTMHFTRRRSAALLTAGAAALSLLTAACGGSTNPSDRSSAHAAYKLTASTPAPSGDIDSFSWSLYAEPASLDYAYAFDYPPNQVLANVCESLLRWNPDLTISPGLAEKYESPNPTTWVYTIRQGVTFHDGSPLTADDVVASLQRHLDPNVGSYWGSVFANVKSIDKTGPNQVTVTLAKPDSMFNQYMAVSPGTVESAKTLAADGADYGNATKGVNCTGPFQFGSWTSGQDITLKRYDHYWDHTLKAKSGAVKFVFLSDPNTRVNAWQSGQVDGGWMVPANAYAQLTSGGQGSLYYGVNTTVVNEIVNNLSGPLGDPRVRQALLMATDRAGLVKTGEQGVGEVAQSLVSKNNWVGVPSKKVDEIYGALPKYPYDVAAAKTLAKDAGVNGQKIVIATSPISASADLITAAVTQAAKEIGLDPQIQTISPDKYTALFTDPAARAGIDLFLTVWYTSLADPMEMYGVLRTGQFSNYGSWSDASYDSVAELALASVPGDARTDAMTQAQQIAMKNLPWLPLYTVPTNVWMSKRISGVKPSIDYLYYPWAAAIGAK